MSQADSLRHIADLWDLMESKLERLALAESGAVNNQIQAQSDLQDAHQQIESLRRLAACLASAVKCGEEWTDTLEREYRAALSSPPPHQKEEP